MNPMTNVKNITKLCEEELKSGSKTSWHEQYRHSAWVFVGGLHYDLTEGDIKCVFSQFGEPINVHLVRDKDTGKSKGFSFICFEDQRSTDLAVDNLNGAKLLGRTLRVDHVESYKPPKNVKDGEISEEKKSEVKKKKKKKRNKEPLKDISPTFEKPNELNEVKKYQNKKTEKYNHGEYFDSSDSDVHCRKRKEVRIKKNRKRRDSDDEFELQYKSEISEAKLRKKSKRKLDSSGSSLSPSPFSLSPLSSLTFLSSPSSSFEDKKPKKLKTDRYDFQKKNKTVKDLKIETELIQAELKRRHMDELLKKSHRDLKEKPESKKESKKKESKSGSSKQQLEDDIKILKERFESRWRDKKHLPGCSHDGHHSGRTDKVTESKQKHQ